MRRARLKASAGVAKAYYHCVTRVVNREFVLGDEEKEIFVKLMRRWERFCQVRVITHCIMSNHVHLLVEVPERPALAPSDEQLLKHLRSLYSAVTVKALGAQLEAMRQSGSESQLAELRESFLRRMWDISVFMKLLKQQFSQWFNRRHGRKGTLWEERFKSVLVEGAGEALGTMAAYIDLNPVRAGVVEDPKDYRWCGYGSAVAGNRGAREGLGTVIAALRRPGEGASRVLAEYRVQLFGRGEQTGLDDLEAGVRAKRGLGREAVKRVLAEGGKLSRLEMLRCRVRYFADGAALGSKEFVNAVFLAQRHRFGPKRRDGARRLRHVDAGGLRVLRDLRVAPIG